MEVSNSIFYAHSTGNLDRSGWQLLSDHLRNVGSGAAQNARYFEGKDCAEIVGLLHDIGKYTREFQGRLAGDLARVDHATRGALIACERYPGLGKLLAYGIAGHHAGLANGLSAEKRTCLKDRLCKDLPALSPIWNEEIQLNSQPALPPLKQVAERRYFQFSFLGRMLFSCLVDADFLDTEAFFATVNREPRRNRKFPRLEVLRDQLNRYLARFKADTPVNEMRAHILQHVRKQAELAPGLFSLNVPTGGGKTLSSLAFALDHAIRHGLRRVIFVIPFTSIVEQNAAVFREALGNLGDAAVLEHHSAFVDDKGSAPQSREKLKKAMENWDAPIVVTTSVQFFESLYADRPSRCRKLHNITGSVVILDEAQTLPLKLLRPCVAAMDELALNYRTSVVLCTATQPALSEQDGFRSGLRNVRELAPEPQQLHDSLERVRVRHLDALTDEALTSELLKHDQVLCIVNNRRHAHSLYEAICHEPGARHLTTLMCARHRSEALKEIRQRLVAGEPCRLISTSLIEAGVDVDFPAVFRAEAGLDSIAQAAGRCNREGRRPADASEVSVFSVGSDWPTPPELEQFAQAARSVFRQHQDSPLSLDAINSYFSELYWQKGPQQLDVHDLLGKLEAGQIDGIPYETLATNFQMIESRMLPIIIPYDEEARRALRDLENAESCSGIARRLQPYIVQVPEQGFISLRKAGAVQPVQPERYGEQFMMLANMDIYSDRYGLNWSDSAFIRAENTVI